MPTARSGSRCITMLPPKVPPRLAIHPSRLNTEPSFSKSGSTGSWCESETSTLRETDAAAAIVGGLGMGPGANIGDTCAIFEATHGTAPKHAGLDRINPGSVILSGVMMLEYMGWQEAADLIKKGIAAAIANRQVTYDLARLMEPPVNPPLKCSEFADAIISHFGD